MTVEQLKACDAIMACRSGALGYIEGGCVCGYRELYPASCRNRHCPGCQQAAALRWVEAWRSKVPDAPTYHLVFTVPASLRVLFLFARKDCYGALFSICRQAIEDVCSRDRRLKGVQLGMIAMLHTWGDQLQYHPHLHVVLCGAGYRRDGTWVQLADEDGWLLPVRKLSARFRTLCLDWFSGQIDVNKATAFGLPQEQVRSQLRRARLHKWRTFINRSRCGAQYALAYLGRYAYRVGIAPKRIVSYDGEKVTLGCKSRNSEGLTHTCRMEGCEFVRRLLAHVLPQGFRKIRAYGFLVRNTAPPERIQAARVRPSPSPAPVVPCCPKCSRPLGFLFLATPGACLSRCTHSPPPVRSERIKAKTPTDLFPFNIEPTTTHLEPCVRTDAPLPLRPKVS